MLLSQVETPSYIIDEGKLIDNLKVLERVQQEADCKILLAQKAFSNYFVYPLIGKYLAGTTASGLYEARLGKEEMGKENHVFAPAYKETDFDELVNLCDHIIFNSVAQLMKYKDKCLKAGVSIGLRINPEHSTQGDHAIYDPCARGSRLGVTLSNLQQALAKDPTVLDGVDGLHFHTLCEQNSDDLESTVEVVKEKFGQYLEKMNWINMGGGHHISREDYDVNRLIRIIKDIKETYDVEVYLEPGEAIALNAGYLITEVLDIVDNKIKTLILDASAACHMPDVLEMPYRPPLMNSYEYDKKPYKYRLSSYTCLAGDIIGDYSFNREIKVGDRLVFEDMAIYSMVKNNTFNGIPLPSIYLQKENGECQLIKKFGYEDFKNRLS
ncbi:carboxynorspermidine decarboxylase [Pseudobutyrivibrio xylanivorans]|uniref:Carboxynorspermidine decarboxylase n=1 Tax=Pseudobutyrivibrio xylanivorans DSM 14809 TaxID=1123012 RepID=A0A1M6HBP1_PSEXY|nr:carboxynorspermidine decarboxylase [Pseudobutyrivibrio xylanivorans]SHJ19544.1 carboxynorspermidine decarboxylase [Pseudobutyrivibrio xylanivorans DSM 14809]